MSWCHVVPALVASLTLATSLTWAQQTLCGDVLCGFRAICNEDTKKCECPLSNPEGDATYLCHTPQRLSCLVGAEQDLKSFSGSRADVNFPCKFTLAKFDTKLMSRAGNLDPPADWNLQDPGRDRCRFNIHATQKYSGRGSLFLDSVDVLIAINVGGSSNVQSLVVRIQGGTAVYTYSPYASVTVNRNSQTDCTPITLDATNSISIALCYVEDYQAWSVGFPACGTTYLSYRPWNSTNNAKLKPGFSLTTDGNRALFTESASHFPSTLCGTDKDSTADPYSTYAEQKGIKDTRDVTLYSFMTESPPIQPHSCVSSLTLFNVCTEEQKIQVANNCGPILTKFSKCVARNGKDPLKVYESCIAAVCVNPPDCAIIGPSVRGASGQCNSFEDPC